MLHFRGYKPLLLPFRGGKAIFSAYHRKQCDNIVGVQRI
jgi:hypothetical protein